MKVLIMMRYQSVVLKALLVFILSLNSVLSSTHAPPRDNTRFISSHELNIQNYLDIDRFHYYLTEFIDFKTGKLDQTIIDELRRIDPEYIFSHQLSRSYHDAFEYDRIIYEILNQLNPNLSLTEEQIQWEYNFLKRKLNNSFQLNHADFSTSQITHTSTTEVPQSPYEYRKNIFRQEMTLNSDHYISDRMTRAVFWEAIDSGRMIDIHIGDTRDFLQHLKHNNGEVVATIQPVARNYNKIYLVRYPGEEVERIAISGIGGVARLEHLSHHLSLSNFQGRELINTMTIWGNIELYHLQIRNRLTAQLSLMPRFDQVIIGQQGAINKAFNSYSKIQALINLYQEEPNLLRNLTGGDSLTRAKNRVLAIIHDGVDQFSQISQHFSEISKVHAAFAEVFDQRPDLRGPTYMSGAYQTSLANLNFYHFVNHNGVEKRWLLVSNVWGDEIAPIAAALKDTGNNQITYIGTAGALPDQGYRIGDLVIPEQVIAGDQTYRFLAESPHIEGAKQGGQIVHVNSPFEEDQSWLRRYQGQAQFVEIETAYLARIFNEAEDRLNVYLMISDILGEEGQGLNNAASRKTRRSLLSLIDHKFNQVGLIGSRAVPAQQTTFLEQVRRAVDHFFEGRSGINSYKNYIISHFLTSQTPPTVNDVRAFHLSTQNFTDQYFVSRLVQISEVTSKIIHVIDQEFMIPQLSFSNDFVEGRWNPKDTKLVINLHAPSDQILQKYREIINQFSSQLGPLSDFLEVHAIRGPPTEGTSHFRPSSINGDYLVDFYTHTQLQRTGLNSTVNRSGNFSFHFIPTQTSSHPCPSGFCALSFFPPNQETRAALAHFDGHNSTSIILNRIEIELQKTIREYEINKALGYAITDVESIADGSLAKLVPRISETEGLIIELLLTPEAKNNPLILLEEMAHIQQIQREFKGILPWVETTLNAQYGSLRSQRALLEMEVKASYTVSQIATYHRSTFFNNDPEAQQVIDRFVEARRRHAKEKLQEINPELRKENRLRNRIERQFADLQRALEREELKLNDYIARNDRTAVRHLIESYMPWSQMEPTEIATWTRWLEAMENPTTDPAKKRVYFRGLDPGPIREGVNGSYYYMSTLLTRNQGNFTRRLRSLKTYRQRLLSQLYNRVPQLGIEHISDLKPKT